MRVYILLMFFLSLLGWKMGQGTIASAKSIQNTRAAALEQASLGQ